MQQAQNLALHQAVNSGKIQILNNKQRSLDYARYGEQQLSGLGN